MDSIIISAIENGFLVEFNVDTVDGRERRRHAFTEKEELVEFLRELVGKLTPNKDGGYW